MLQVVVSATAAAHDRTPLHLAQLSSIASRPQILDYLPREDIAVEAVPEEKGEIVDLKRQLGRLSLARSRISQEDEAALMDMLREVLEKST